MFWMLWNYNTFAVILQHCTLKIHFLDVVKLQYICSNFTTLYIKDTFSCNVKWHCALLINFHYIYCKITIEIFSVCQSLIQSDNAIESIRPTDRHFCKNRFFWLRGPQNVKIWWKFLNYNENVKSHLIWTN